MKKFVRFAGVALLALAIGGGCGGDDDPVTPVAPPTPPPPPVQVTMSPASQTIGVGGTVVFAVSVSGGVAGEAASWTCASSDPSKATVALTPAGCAATAVSAGGVTITAVVTKGGATVNTAAGLTILEDMAERASLFILSIMDSDEDDEVLMGTVNVTISVDPGDQMLRKLSVLVDGVVAKILSFDGASMVAAAPEGEEGERAAQQAAHPPFDLSFNSAAYDEVTGKPTYMNGERMISAKLMVESSDEPIESGSHPHEFDNGDGVHVTVSGLGEGAMNSGTGQRWYGGPEAALEITALPVLYSGGSAASVSVTLLGFCGADAATETSETSVTFTPECDATSNTVATVIDEVVTDPAGDFPVFIIGDAEADILGDHVFPLYLDYEGPDAPYFNVNPNGREEGWVNRDVDFRGEFKSSNKDGWLVYNEAEEDEEEGVGGYDPQLRFSSTTPSIVAGALEATANALPTEPTKTNAACVIATAMDLLDNESKLPSAEKPCVTAAVYQALVDVLEAAEDDDAIAVAQGKIPAGIRAGLDVTAPTAEFTDAGPKESPAARELKEFQVRVVDEEDGSGLPALPLLASISIRTANNKMSCGKDDDDLPGYNSLTGECKSDTDGYRFIGALGTTTGLLPTDDAKTGYYTFSAYARDKAGNKSTGISRVALHDPTMPAVGIIGGNWDKKTSEYSVTVTLTDDFSIRDYYVTLDFADEQAYLPVASGIFRVKAVEGIDGYDSELSQSEILTKDVGAFRALQPASGVTGTVSSDADPLELTDVMVYARAQAGLYSSASGPVAVTDMASGSGFQGKEARTVAVDDAMDLDNAATKDIVEGNHIVSFTAKADADELNDLADNDYDQDDTIELRAMVVGYERNSKEQIGTPMDGTTPASEDYMAKVVADLFANPFSRVDFYAEAHGDGDLRLVASIPASSAYPVSVNLPVTEERTDADTEVTWIYVIDVSAADFHDAVGAGRSNYGLPTARRQLVAVGVHESGNGVALVSPMVDISIEN